jgi:hypothetical protein
MATMLYFFSYGIVEGIKRAIANLPIAQKMVMTGRMGVGLPHRSKGAGTLRAILAKATEVEARERAGK